MPRGVPKVKKGKASWKPAAMLTVTEAVDGHRTRWVSKDPMNLQKKMAEGWVYANEVNGIKREHEHPENVGDGHSMTTTTEYRELVLMALPEDVAEARAEYFNEMTEKQTRGLKRNLEDDMKNPEGGSAEIHGKIVIE